MATTYEAIATVTVGSGGAANIEFTSIPATYTDLVVKVSGRAANAANSAELYIRFNGVATGYSSKLLYGSGSSVGSSTETTMPGLATAASDTASTFGNTEFYIPNYAGSNNKSVSTDGVSENNATAAYQYLNAGLWSNTAAITSIALTTNKGNFVQYSTATLYGIKNS